MFFFCHGATFIKPCCCFFSCCISVGKKLKVILKIKSNFYKVILKAKYHDCKTFFQHVHHCFTLQKKHYEFTTDNNYYAELYISPNFICIKQVFCKNRIHPVILSKAQFNSNMNKDRLKGNMPPFSLFSFTTVVGH